MTAFLEYIKAVFIRNIHLEYSFVVLLILVALSAIFRIEYSNLNNKLVPSSKVTFLGLFELANEYLYNLTKDIIGRDSDKYFPLVASLFFYILVSNMFGLIPGLLPPTDNINTNAASSILVFIYYNYVGIKTHGIVKYFKSFLGPVIWIMPLIFTTEIISNFIRPVSLSIRLLGNMVGDHMVMNMFSQLTPWIIPIPFYFLAGLVSVIQAFIFTILSITYISLAQQSHD